MTRSIMPALFAVAWIASMLIGIVAASEADKPGDYHLRTFKTIKLTDGIFHAEGAHMGDFNNDGQMDVVAGPFWYEGPDFAKAHEYRPAKPFDPKGYSDNFLTFVHDFSGDGWDDILVIGWPGYRKDHEHLWFENPATTGTDKSHWKKHLAYKTVDNESPTLADLTGDGKPELVFHTGGFLGWAAPDWKNPTKPWTFHKLSTKGKWQRYTHGLGVGDVNGDGRMDLLEANGWWEQPESLEGDPVWKRHIWRFAKGGAQMFAYDVDGDGDNDVITSDNGHGFGLMWLEHYKDDGVIKFHEHRFMNAKPEENRYGVKFSQLHALDLVDMNGDGLKDIVTGKRFWAHGPKGDAEPNAPAVLYWFELRRGYGGQAGAAGVDFVPHLIHDDSGVGTQVTAGDINGDGHPDVVVSNKKGSFVHIQQVKPTTKAAWEAAQPKAVH